MPTKIVPMNPAMTKSMSGSASATAVLSWRSRVISVTAGEPHEFLVQPAAFLRDGDHFQRRAGEKRAAIREARAERFALFHPLGGVGDEIDQRLIAERTARDGERADQRNAGAEQRAEHAAKARHGDLRRERADDRRAQEPRLPEPPAALAARTSSGRSKSPPPMPASR